MLARKITIRNYFDGPPTLSDFELIEETIPDTLNDGEVLLKGECFSIDPYMRAFGNRDRINVGDTMVGSQIATVLKSKNIRFEEGSKVVAYVGWRDMTICNPDKMRTVLSSVLPLPDLKGLPYTYALGPLGMPGMAAYFGFLKLCEPKKGETVVVSSGGGAVGSLVGQIAKIKGCKVVGFAGNEEKVKWITEDLKFDFAFNYKEIHLDKILKKFALEGVDCYFDSVGGEFTYTVMRNMNEFGRIALCGAISTYNDDPRSNTKVSFDYASMIYKQIRMEGFLVNRWFQEWKNGIVQMAEWIQEDKIQVRETHTKGFENMPQAFIDMLEGKTIGKALVMA